MEVVKGQKVWVNDSIYGIVETTIKTVGRKYINTEHRDRIKYDKKTLQQVDYVGNANYIILDIEKYNKDQYYFKLGNKLRRLNWKKLKREDLDKVAQIISEYEEFKE